MHLNPALQLSIFNFVSFLGITLSCLNTLFGFTTNLRFTVKEATLLAVTGTPKRRQLKEIVKGVTTKVPQSSSLQFLRRRGT